MIKHGCISTMAMEQFKTKHKSGVTNSENMGGCQADGGNPGKQLTVPHITRWNDNTVVTVISSVLECVPNGIIKRWRMMVIMEK